MPAAGEKVGELAEIVYVAVATPLAVYPPPEAMALRVVVVETAMVHGFEQEVDEVVGAVPFVV